MSEKQKESSVSVWLQDARLRNLSREETRDLTLDFFFDDMESCKDIFWPIGFAVLWIIWRNHLKVEFEWERFRCSGMGRRLWKDGPSEEQVLAPRSAEAELLRAMQSGTIDAIGSKIPSSEMVVIPSFAWANMIFFGADPADTMDCAFVKGMNKPTYNNVRLQGKDLIVLWPIGAKTKSLNTTSPSQSFVGKSLTRVGRPPDVMTRVKLEMLEALDRGEDLLNLKGKQLAERFKASRTLCSEVRKFVLSQRVNAN